MITGMICLSQPINFPKPISELEEQGQTGLPHINAPDTIQVSLKEKEQTIIAMIHSAGYDAANICINKPGDYGHWFRH